jgi:purine nucleosidase
MSATVTDIILDCDPGHDDAIALLLALASPDLRLLGVTTVSGNQTLEKTTANAIRVLDHSDRLDIPVAAGADRPLVRERDVAAEVHGETGLDGPDLPPPSRPPEPAHAIDWIAMTLSASPNPVTLVPTGPLTNIALFLARYPELTDRIERIVLMGGAIGEGNATPSAEFNIWADPEAAAIVFGAAWPNGVRMIGLDVTLLARATAAVQDRMRTLGALGSTLLLPALAQYRDSADSAGEPPVHDVCAVVSIADPSVFTYTPAVVQVETHGSLTSGMTVTDFSESNIPNARVATGIAADRFWDVALNAYASVAARMG